MATFPIWTIMSILEEVMDLLLSFWSPYWALFGLFRNQIIFQKALYTNLLAHQPRGDNSPHRFQIATFRAFPAKLGKTHRKITERHPPPFKKNLVKIQNILQSVEMWARLKNSNIGDVSPRSDGRVRIFKSMRLHQYPDTCYFVFYSSRSYKETNMQ